MLLVGVGETLRQFARALVVDVDHACHAFSSPMRVVLRPKDARTHQVPHSLRSVLVTARLRELVNFGRKLVIDGDGDPLHGGLNT